VIMAHTLACRRRKVVEIRNRLPDKYITGLERNQLIASCCRHPEEHEVEAFYSCDDELDKRTPDIYIFHCTCGRRHTYFCVGTGPRATW